MSEEILKALMQLFAIISKQNGGGSLNHLKYIREFLKNQLSTEKVPVYLELYNEHLNESNVTQSGLTSVKDSVRTLSICKKINKTLSHKQKIIVLFRICEFVHGEPKIDPLQLEILETAAKVFNVERSEFDAILYFTSLKTSSDLRPIEQTRLLSGSNNFPEELREYHVFQEGIIGIFLFVYVRSSGTILFRFFNEQNIYMNGLAISEGKGYILTQGATVRTSKSSIYYNEILNLYQGREKNQQIQFSAVIEQHKFSGNKIALRDIEIYEESGTLFGIMGGSGAGKTTLLNVMSGLEKSPSARIELNGNNIHSKVARGNVGYIPQDDLLMEELSVYQNLYYNAKLCNSEWSETEIIKRVIKVLDDLGLSGIRDIKVGNALNKKISGGQRKRLNIALELIREPEVLFVDEPTSGLSSKDSENVMDLLKQLSQEGKIIFVVIHQPSSEIFKLFDKIYILDQGGYPVFYGSAIDSVVYFKSVTNQINKEIAECISCGNVNPELIFNTLEDKEIDEFGNYTANRKISPEKWNEYFKEQFKPATKAIENAPLKATSTPSLFKQLKVFFTRDFLSRKADLQYVLIALLEAPVLAFILSIIIRKSNNSEETGYIYNYNENIPAYIFMLIIVSLFIGLSISAEEIFKDRKIIKREQFLQLSKFSYYNSKVLYLIILSLIQSGLFCLIGNLVVGVYDMFFWYWLMSFSIFLFGNLSGLVLSSSFNSIVTIYVIIPFILIPQMILGGAMFKYDNLSKVVGGGYSVPLVADIMASRWAYEGLMVAQFKNNGHERNFYEYDQLLSKYNYRISYLYPKLNDLLEEERANGAEDDTKAPLTVINTLTREAEIESFSNASADATKPDFSNLTIAQADSVVAAYEESNQQRYNMLSRKKDMVVYAFDEQHPDMKSGVLKMMCENENINEIVQNTLSKEKGYIEDNLVKQNMDQIYMSDHLLTKSLFSENPMFVPFKKAGPVVMDTYWYNLIVIWLYCLIAYLILYFGLLKKIIDFKLSDFLRKNRRES